MARPSPSTERADMLNLQEPLSRLPFFINFNLIKNFLLEFYEMGCLPIYVSM